MKILLPVDGSVYTKRMLSYIAAHEELLGPGHEYTALHVVPAIPPHAARYLDRSAVEDYCAGEAAKVLQPVRDYARQKGWALETVRMTGSAAESIAAHANAGVYGLIVMGTHGHAALGSAILGSVASGVLARCQTPVLLIR